MNATAPHPSQERLRFQARYGPWAVVTGASDGIGSAMAKQIAAYGINVVLVARRVDRLQQVAASIEASSGVATRVVAGDLSERAVVAAVLQETSGLDTGLFVAAAGFGTSGPFLQADIDDEAAMIDLNCRTVMIMSHHFGGRFAARKRGGIVFMSSLLAFQGVPNAANYAATKAYVQALAEALHVELAPAGVSVIASAPGPTASGFAARADMRMTSTVTAQSVAAGTLMALGRQMTVRPGFLSQFLEASLSVLPRWGRVRMMASIMNGMTRHQRSGKAGPDTAT